jgi:hypothetical protein
VLERVFPAILTERLLGTATVIGRDEWNPLIWPVEMLLILAVFPTRFEKVMFRGCQVAGTKKIGCSKARRY